MSLECLSSSIPKIIHQIVIGSKRTTLIDNCLKSWSILKELGFEIRIWDDHLILDFILNEHKFAYDAFINSRNHAEAADIARYLIIHTYGGYYVDWDVELLNVKEFLKLSASYPTGYMLCDPPNLTLASEYFCSQKGDEYLLNLVSDIIHLYESNERDVLPTPQYSGPYRMRDSLAIHKKTFMVSIPVKEAFAYDYSEIRNPPLGEITQAMMHYWVHSWL